MADPTKLTAGAVFARDFKIVKPLREGGMGAVYVAEQISTGRQRALKLMAPELVGNPEIRERFIREAKVAANIESDHVVETVTAGVDEETGAPYLVMELLRGEELADAAQRSGPLMVADVREIFSQIGHALEQAHAQGLVHRDLKPENIFLAASKRRDVPFTAKILDFGIAKLVADGMQKTGTQPLGSPLFMSPEQTDRKGRICPATDVWALGLIAFYLLTGTWFWRAATDDSLPALLREVCVDPIPRASERARELGVEGALPIGFDSWFARCVDRDIDNRFPDAGACVRAFAELVADAPADRKLSMVATSGMNTGSLGRDVDVNAATAIVEETGAIAPSPKAQTLDAPPTHGTTSGAGVEMVASQTAPSRSRGSVVAGGVVAAGLLAMGVYWFGFRGTDPSAAATSSAPTSTASVAPSAATAAGSASAVAAVDSRCPAGMMYHPAGTTFMGSRTLNPASGANVEGRQVKLSSFCLDKTEVTVRAYEACVAKGKCERTPDDVDYGGPEDEKKPFIAFCNARKAGREDHPINCLSFRRAERFCSDRGARLPTEAEWEYAARGSGQNDFPWGNQPPDPTRLNAAGTEYAGWAMENLKKDQPMMYAADDHYVGTAPVGSFPAGASSWGVLDLAGNVWEWTSDFYAPYEPGELVDPKGPADGTERVIRGGAFNGSDPQWANPAWRYRSAPERYTHAIGFRCAADVAGEPRAK
ncbi:MAG: SUMF1/EgtB/PvdO family nonheme iron enzyme [Polyangiaceae bacterium]|nr:SUMF1/EgtB/PvdO family nonheme iron enzyme [Polyangiaceae bacterium]